MDEDAVAVVATPLAQDCLTDLRSVETDDAAFRGRLNDLGQVCGVVLAERLPAEPRYVFLTVTLRGEAEGTVTGYIANQTDLRLRFGEITKVNGNEQTGFSTLLLSAGDPPPAPRDGRLRGRGRRRGRAALPRNHLRNPQRRLSGCAARRRGDRARAGGHQG